MVLRFLEFYKDYNILEEPEIDYIRFRSYALSLNL